MTDTIKCSRHAMRERRFGWVRLADGWHTFADCRKCGKELGFDFSEVDYALLLGHGRPPL
jgi:hypothetical protein